MGLKELFKPRQDGFLQSRIRQAEITSEGTDTLEASVKKRSGKNASSVGKPEKNADEVRRIVIDDLNDTFVSPFDRGDASLGSGCIPMTERP